MYICDNRVNIQNIVILYSGLNWLNFWWYIEIF